MNALQKAVKDALSCESDQEFFEVCEDIVTNGAMAGWPGFTNNYDCLMFWENNKEEIIRNIDEFTLNYGGDMGGFAGAIRLYHSDITDGDLAMFLAGIQTRDSDEESVRYMVANAVVWWVLECVAVDIDYISEDY